MSGQGCGHGQSSTNSKDEATTTHFQIIWGTATNTSHTSKMVKWLVDHPIDCIVLFSKDKSTPWPEGQASARTKLEICAIVADLVFKNDKEYGLLFAMHTAKFAKAIQDHLGIYEVVEKGFLWYSDLLSLWWGIPSYTPKAVINSTPGASWGTQLLTLIQNKTLFNTAAPLDSPIVSATGTLIPHAAGLPATEYQDKGKQHAANVPFEDEPFKSTQNFDMDMDNFQGPDHFNDGDREMGFEFA
ncbi:hypothetical protein BS17DRAFT_765175 [Gyrodon lividus]|nr:hypothetical protein BS17DRAFT_765175 [Gyrodon lividus]